MESLQESVNILRELLTCNSKSAGEHQNTRDREDVGETPIDAL